MRLPVAGAVLGAVFVLSPARAASPAAVKVEVLIVKASDKGNAIDPRLAHFAEDLQRRKLSYSSFAVAGDATLTLAIGKPGEVKLPSGKRARLEFRQVDTDGKLRLKIEVPGHAYVTYSIGDGGEFYFEAGRHGAADLWLLLTHHAG